MRRLMDRRAFLASAAALAGAALLPRGGRAQREPHGEGAAFRWREADTGSDGVTIWSLFKEDTRYFDPGKSRFMINYRVENLDALLSALEAEGVEVDPRRENHPYGRFAWIMDPEGNRIELWEPPKAGP